MKTIQFRFLFATVAIISLSSCSEEYLEVEARGKFSTENYYKNEEQATAALIGVYDPMRKNSGGFENMITMMNAGSDDFFAGGGSATDGATIQNFSNHVLNSIQGNLDSFWDDPYQGINRSNTLLQKLPKATMSDDLKSRFTAESKALRAIYYFNLVRMFKNIPLILEPITPDNVYNQVQVTPQVIYAQIEKDLLDAIAVLPATITATELGRISKAGAQAMLGKVYLFENKKAEAAAILAEVNGTPGLANKYGNKLLQNFGELWDAKKKFNSESLIEVNHSGLGNSGWGDGSLWAGDDEGNMVCQMIGPRGYGPPAVLPNPTNDLLIKKENDDNLARFNTSAPKIATIGWSFNTVTQDLYDAMKLDPRFGATIFDMKALKDSKIASYVPNNQDTGYFFNKFLPKKTDIAVNGQPELNYSQNSYLIRLADTYLMEAEALGSGDRAQKLLDAVRARVGLPSVPISLNAIKEERRLELAGEGHRFFDLVRWGDANSKLVSRGFTVGVDEIFPIPLKEIQGTKLKQNPGYD
jgi:starch-binding outer membrane protein, SusD/RagB family